MILVFLAIVVLTMVGLGSALATGLAGVGALVLLSILFLKVFFVLMLFGFIGRRFSGRRRSWNWDGPSWRGRSRSGQEEPSVSREERFEEWHRMAHAHEEVDGWFPNLDDTEAE